MFLNVEIFAISSKLMQYLHFSALSFINKRIGNSTKPIGISLEAEDISNNTFANKIHQENDAYLASGSYDGTLSIWNINTRSCVKSIKAHFPHRLSGLASSNDGLTLVSVGWDGKIIVSLFATL